MPKLFLENDAYPSIRDDEGRLVLRLACWKDHWEAVQLLLEYDADIHAVDSYRKTMIRNSAINEDPRVLRFLLDKNEVNINSKDAEGLIANLQFPQPPKTAPDIRDKC